MHLHYFSLCKCELRLARTTTISVRAILLLVSEAFSESEIAEPCTSTLVFATFNLLGLARTTTISVRAFLLLVSEAFFGRRDCGAMHFTLEPCNLSSVGAGEDDNHL